MADKKKEKSSPLADAYPNVADLALGDGWIELGYCYNSRTYARAINEGGALWVGGTEDMTLEELLEAMEQGIAEFHEEIGR